MILLNEMTRHPKTVLKMGGAIVQYKTCTNRTKTRVVARTLRRFAPLMITQVLSDRALSKTIASVNSNRIKMIRTKTTSLATF